ncbi:MAG: hypothetical protein GF320_02880 [Armatimonadia bacterium]|nr:hypothetical protein [Armatimonadia bacterium]
MVWLLVLACAQASAPADAGEPFIAIRGDCIDLPFYLGCDLYHGRWAPYAAEEAGTDGWFHDRDGWRQRFETWAARSMNALMLQHPHPFPAFIDYPEYPEAAYFSPEHVRANAEMLRWIIDTAAEYGVTLYFLTWNEWVPRGYADAHDVPMMGPGTEESAALNAYSYSAFFRRFPDAKLITMAGESPPGCVEFVRENVIEPLATLPEPPAVTFWTWCSYPEDVSYVLEGYPGETSIMHYLQYEQLFAPMVDPRVGMTSHACGDRPMLTIGGLGTATGQLYWSDPFYIRDIIRTAPKNNVAGIFFMGLDSWSWVSDKWIGWEALARYWLDPYRGDDRGYWEERINRELGPDVPADAVLDAYIHASGIPTRMLALTHSQSDIFRPQYGLPLVFYLGMPTLSTYVFENHEAIDDQGRLSPRLGLTWPNPGWGEDVLGVRDYVLTEPRSWPAGATKPLDIADELEDHGRTVLAGLDRWPEHPRVLEMNAWLGLHVADKIRAAVAWQRWAIGEADPTDVLDPLDSSIAHFHRYAQVGDELYPRSFGQVTKNYLTKPPPWTNLDLWRSYRHVDEYSFGEWASRFERERRLIADAMADGRVELPYEADLAPPIQGEMVAGIAEDGPWGGFRLIDAAPSGVASMAGGRLICEQDGTHADFYFPFVTDPEELPLQPGTRYQLNFRYQILRVGEEHPLKMSTAARTTEGTWRRDVGLRFFEGPPGTAGNLMIQFTPEEFEDYYVYLSLQGDGAVAVSNVQLLRESPDEGPEGG